jgi:hypothetical protein
MSLTPYIVAYCSRFGRNLSFWLSLQCVTCTYITRNLLISKSLMLFLWIRVCYALTLTQHGSTLFIGNIKKNKMNKFVFLYIFFQQLQNMLLYKFTTFDEYMSLSKLMKNLWFISICTKFFSKWYCMNIFEINKFTVKNSSHMKNLLLL